MTSKEIRKLAEEKIKLGKTRQQVLEELIPETNEPEIQIAKVVRFIPTLSARERFKTANSILGIILVITVILKLFTSFTMFEELGLFTLILPIVNIILAFQVFRYNGSIYKIILLLSIISLFNILPKTNDFNLFLLITNLSIIAILVGLSFYLGNKLVSNYEMKKQWGINKEGKNIMVDKICFDEAE